MFECSNKVRVWGYAADIMMNGSIDWGVCRQEDIRCVEASPNTYV